MAYRPTAFPPSIHLFFLLHANAILIISVHLDKILS